MSQTRWVTGCSATGFSAGPRVRVLCGLLAVLALAACKGAVKAPGDEPAAPVVEPRWHALHAPDKALYVVPQLRQPGPHYNNLYYEANNIALRGALDAHGLPIAGGEAIAARWADLARQVGGVFALRDSLFSQQDHPVKHRAKSLMLPPSWVTVAVSAARRGVELAPVQAPRPDDDAAWAAFDAPENLFGGFPPSDTLHREATRPLAGATEAQYRRTTHARQAVHTLAGYSTALLAALPRGAQVVAATGARIIAEGDAHYFGAELRHSRIIPIFVHNPSAREIAEGKGMRVPGNAQIASEDVALATRAIYGRRLRAGDMAVERYDLSQPEERAKAIALLTELLPENAPSDEGGTLWLWVTGPLAAGSKLVGENAAAYIELFREEVAAAPIDTTRLRFLSKPRVVLPPGLSRQAAFEQTLEQFGQLGLWFSIDLNSITLERLLRGLGDSKRNE